ncbi:site-2 protease family protein [Nocardioides sp.]|jgi:Zn-dependent protease|uniref:site-2 protease family protein n=1 Tax=Nocardioides sp. TaxID=35761 RepID=UPI002F3E394B
MSNGRASRGSTPRPPGTFKVGSIAGSDVLVSSSWFLIAGLIAVITAPAVESAEPGLGPLKYVGGLALAVLLYLSVLAHEASHALVARRYGLPVSHITLQFFGGMTSIDGEPDSPRQEFWISVVGPLSSLAVALVSFLASLVAPGGLIGLALSGLAWTNLFVGIINLVPGLPLDGGRILKALVWGVSGDTHRGTIVAAWGGRVVAILAIGYPFMTSKVLGVKPTVIDFVFAGVISMFLWTGATQALESARVRSRLPHLVARDLARRTLTVPGELPLAEAVRRAQEAEAGSIVTVTSGGVPVGVVNEAALLSVPVERRAWVPTSSVARTLEEGLWLPSGIGGEELIRAISARPSGEYLLLDPDGTIFGVLSTADVDRAFRASA